MWQRTTAIIAVLTLCAPAAGTPQTVPSAATYTWPAEFVSADTAAMTVKPRVAYAEAISELKQFKAGDKVSVVWSGVDNYSDAVRQVRRAEQGRKIDEPLVMPAEFVSAEPPNQYVTIRVKVPESSMAVVKALKPGEWVTVTSRTRPSNDAEAIVTVAPYGTKPSTT